MIYVEESEWLDPKKALASPGEFVAAWSAEYRYPNQGIYILDIPSVKPYALAQRYGKYIVTLISASMMRT